MPNLRQAAQQALEALHYGKANKAVTILREALEQPVQEPVGEVTGVSDNGFKCEFNQRLAVGTKLYIAPPLPVQEPVAYYHPHKGFYWAKPTHISAPTVVDVPPMPLYATPPAAQRPWVGLTDEEILSADPRIGKPESDVNPYQILGSARDLEALLKDRNT